MPGRDPRTSPNARFLSPDMQDGRARRPIGNALSVSVLTHAAGFLCIALAISRLPAADPSRKTPSEPPSNITWIAQPGRGGGGSGNDRLEPPREARLPGRDVLTVPVTRPPANAAELPKDPPKLEHVQIPAVTTMAGVQELPGIISPLSPVAITNSQGPGSGGRGGQGTGSGDGPGAGPGLGPGRNGGTGGDAYQIGNGVMPPRLIRELKPGYTSEAMRARIQGMVTLQAVVMPDGSVGTARVVRSLDSTFGLDQEALKTVRLWHFIPGTLAGRAVPMLVEVELTFTLR